MKRNCLFILLVLTLAASLVMAEDDPQGISKDPYLGRVDPPREFCLFRSCHGEVVEKE